MAFYKYEEDLKKCADDAFDRDFKPAGKISHSGIYRCRGCGWEVVAEAAKQLPPQNHDQHSPGEGEIRWRLVAWALHQKK